MVTVYEETKKFNAKALPVGNFQHPWGFTHPKAWDKGYHEPEHVDMKFIMNHKVLPEISYCIWSKP